MSYMQKKLSLLNGRKYYKFFKRAIDVIGGAVLLVIFSPIYFTTAIAIVLDSKGPIFADVPERIGEQKKKLKKDPRVTNVGRFIRKHSIDEIPQLLNVLKGEMSLVGPRAYYPDELENQ